MTGLIFLGLLPLLIFAVLDAFFGPRAGVLGALGVAAIVLPAEWALTGGIETTSFIEVGLVLGLGLASLKMRSPLAFRLQPAVSGFVLALFVSYFQFFDTPLLQRYASLTEKLPGDAAQVFQQPGMNEKLATLSGHLIIFFLAHAILMTWLALRTNRWAWLSGKLAAYPLLLGLFVFDLLLN